jgi:hypothetical protein
MGLALFLMLLWVPLGLLITVAPAWIEAEAEAEHLALPAPPETEPTGPQSADASHHPATCLAIAAHRGHAYLGFVAAHWHLEELDPMTWLLAGRLRDRFETAMLAAIGALYDWVGTPSRGGIDPRAQLEHEGIRTTLTALIGSLPTFSVDLGPECHYREGALQRICVQLGVLSAAVERQRQAALHPPPTPFR